MFILALLDNVKNNLFEAAKNLSSNTYCICITDLKVIKILNRYFNLLVMINCV